MHQTSEHHLTNYRMQVACMLHDCVMKSGFQINPSGMNSAHYRCIPVPALANFVCKKAWSDLYSAEN